MDNKIMQKWLEAGYVTLPHVLVENYAKLGMDEQELVVVLQLQSFLEKQIYFPSMEDIAKRMTLSTEQAFRVIQALVTKRLIAIKQQDGTAQVLAESYTLEPLWEKLMLLFENMHEEQQVVSQQHVQISLYSQFEQEFGRPLSPMEAEMLSAWIDQDRNNPELIREALKEAVISQKLSFRYIDRILLNWNRQNIKTAEQARAASAAFHEQVGTPTADKTTGIRVKKSENSIPLYDWLDKRKG
ncbi:DnaD domain-containing protein [Listeria booriae]|uniref:DnaD domain-containing protein n=1 Tax=Listeria booriae TaxID=1552123 RepID=A0A7X0X9Q1_9LIST|nr:DnaD domain-containing protein [Listeria booriae]MBC1490215.1 DnaD domain-containing protein [Listeria booriae]MBC1502557.1 DnaD domain-containing protein [Listeria booriae]MBC1523236.1 DnaD domain-containing protein [Listeria booriae]MBC1528809.1 DnaD domain-containing protein [Listeria booriae]MBC2257771.1 DnaD domain-containing protein [Listeria booriae]